MNQVMTAEDMQSLQNAYKLLENPGLAAKITNMLGKPIEYGLDKLPDNVNDKVLKITQSALEKSLSAALMTMNTKDDEKESYPMWHKFAVGAAGAVGGFAGLAVELPISTTIMLRSIADIARAEGEELNSIDTKMACVEVFALGGGSTSDDNTEVGYYIVRAALARSMVEALEFAAEKGVVEAGAPVLIKLLAMIAKRFSIQITEKIAAQAIPVIGAVSGAIINTLFIDHFQDMARGHFCVRRLEKKYGSEFIKNTYVTLGSNTDTKIDSN